MTVRNQSHRRGDITRRLAFGALLMLAACNWGPRPAKLEPAQSPAGIRIAFRLVGEKVDRVAELFAVDSAGMIVHDRQLTRVPWSRVYAMDVYRLDSKYDVQPRETISREKRDRLALVSRFPQGLSGPLLTRVLAELKQGALQELQ
ncbi:MAG: hypothetical protein ABIW79_10710 [Gemmatimonas sp.]